MRKFLTIAIAIALPLAVPALIHAPGSIALAAKPATKAKPASKAKAGADLKNGKRVYEASCASCHGALATKKPTLPSAANFFAGKFARTKGNPAEIEKMIKVGGAAYGKGASPQMPSFASLSAKDRKDVAAFIKNLHGKK